MADANSISTAATSGLYPWSAARILTKLWEEADIKDPEALRGFLHCHEHAKFMLMDLQEIVAGVGCLINEDSGGAGSFQSRESVPGLLFNISRQLDVISGLLEIGEAAESRLKGVGHA